MQLEIVKVQNQGDASKEWVQFRVTSDCSLSHYILTDTTYIDEKTISNKLRHLYWGWTGKSVKKNDHIFVITGTGTNSAKTNDGVTTHYFYWNLKEPVWNNTGDTALLLHLNDWATKRAAGK